MCVLGSTGLVWLSRGIVDLYTVTHSHDHTFPYLVLERFKTIWSYLIARHTCHDSSRACSRPVDLCAVGSTGPDWLDRGIVDPYTTTHSRDDISLYLALEQCEAT